MNKAETYYYDQLNKDQQKVYYAIKQGLLQMVPSFPVLRLDGKELGDIYFMVRMDNPMIFWSVTFKYRYYDDSTYVELIPEYLFTKDKIKEHRQAMESRVKKLARQAEKLEEKGKELYIHDFICENVHYDKLKKEYSHEIIGALGNGVAVCEGIAKAVKALCDALGIDYVNLSDKQIFRDHEPVIWKVPVCADNDHFYYKEKKVSWTTLDEVRNRSRQAAKKGRILLFHWRGGYLTKEILNELLVIFNEEAAAREKHALISLNWPQAVLQVRFAEGTGKENVEMEEANEGEI